jgi:outer membrane immunogenic protein
MFKHLLVAAVALTAVPALAQDDTNFNGFFIGAQTGWQQDKAKVSSNTSQNVTNDGWMYGAQVGYDYRMGTFVLGGEAMISGSSGSNEVIDNLGDSYKLNAGTTWGFSARAGWVVSEPFLLYGRFGYSWASYNYVFNQSIENSYDQDGITVGIGGEYQFNSSVSARLEWNYFDYGQNSFQRPPSPGTVYVPQDLNFERMGVSLGINFRF